VRRGWACLRARVIVDAPAAPVGGILVLSDSAQQL